MILGCHWRWLWKCYDNLSTCCYSFLYVLSVSGFNILEIWTSQASSVPWPDLIFILSVKRGAKFCNLRAEYSSVVLAKLYRCLRVIHCPGGDGKFNIIEIDHVTVWKCLCSFVCACAMVCVSLSVWDKILQSRQQTFTIFKCVTVVCNKRSVT